jgi:hypothetical protein
MVDSDDTKGQAPQKQAKEIEVLCLRRFCCLPCQATPEFEFEKEKSLREHMALQEKEKVCFLNSFKP